MSTIIRSATINKDLSNNVKPLDSYSFTGFHTRGDFLYFISESESEKKISINRRHHQYEKDRTFKVDRPVSLIKIVGYGSRIYCLDQEGNVSAIDIDTE